MKVDVPDDCDEVSVVPLLDSLVSVRASWMEFVGVSVLVVVVESGIDEVAVDEVVDVVVVSID